MLLNKHNVPGVGVANFINTSYIKNLKFHTSRHATQLKGFTKHVDTSGNMLNCTPKILAP